MLPNPSSPPVEYFPLTPSPGRAYLNQSDRFPPTSIVWQLLCVPEYARAAWLAPSVVDSVGGRAAAKGLVSGCSVV
jgi:hypothetical protein